MNNSTFIACGITFGTIVGVIVSVITNQWWWLGICIAIGVTLGAAIPGRKPDS